MSRLARRLLLFLVLPFWAVFGLYAVAVLVLTWFLLMAVVAFIPRTTRGARLARRLSGKWARIVTTLWGVAVVTRRGGVVRGPVLFASNHAGWTDTTILMAALGGDFVFLAMKEMVRWPSIGRAMRKAGHLFVDRTAHARGRAVFAMAGALRNGCSVLVFPEGGFVRAPGLRGFALGGFRAAALARVPVVPVVIRGSRGIIRSGIWIPRPGFVRVIVGRPVTPRNDSREEASRVRERVRRFIAAYCGEPDAERKGG